MIPRWHGTSFDWLTWCGGSLTNLGVRHNTEHIRAMRRAIRDHAIAWCEGISLLCRPKTDTIGVMFLQGEFQWWTHLTREEFDACFPELATDLARILP